jgi:recombination protein RecA
VLFLKENPAIAKEIEDKIRAEKLGVKNDSKAADSDKANEANEDLISDPVQ